jgi:hypothetical protein
LRVEDSRFIGDACSTISILARKPIPVRLFLPITLRHVDSVLELPNAAAMSADTLADRPPGLLDDPMVGHPFPARRNPDTLGRVA